MPPAFWSKPYGKHHLHFKVSSIGEYTVDCNPLARQLDRRAAGKLPRPGKLGCPESGGRAVCPVSFESWLG
jgi:hypothetical protein